MGQVILNTPMGRIILENLRTAKDMDGEHSPG